jgi:serine/threonine-protein kinase HipA
MPILDDANDTIQVNYGNNFAGYLSKQDSIYTFKYDESYVKSNFPAISYNLPVQQDEFKTQHLHPFFDNLVSEGWLRNHQIQALNIAKDEKFNRLKYFGYDLAGTVYINFEDEIKHPFKLETQISNDANEIISCESEIESRASVSGSYLSKFKYEKTI